MNGRLDRTVSSIHDQGRLDSGLVLHGKLSVLSG
jgi:hypothetical protein